MPPHPDPQPPTEVAPLAEGVDLELVPIPGGTFRMGSDTGRASERPVHSVTVPAFYLGKYPVTNAQYQAFVRATGTHAPAWMEENGEYNIDTNPESLYRPVYKALLAPNYPVVGVSWHDAVAFCEWLSEQTLHPYRLPSEAEWEYAARGGSEEFPYAGGYRLEEVGWFNENSRRGNSDSRFGTDGTMPVGLKLSNDFGLYDMSGNVWEWCADHWHDSYDGAPDDGSAWMEGGNAERRVVRGGSWNNFGNYCRVSNRNDYTSGIRNFILGFRVARY